ncbi:MAG: YggS family pyridoxal phosphate-dependent enzyme [Opitutales bacterium]|jgi:pyridoxal phosphate enzyme (YggS family)|nr:MAG: YggS family pyridoxal phosphate-dependent enzyme [Opitutales bacterium]
MVTYDQFKVNYEGVLARIRQACAQCGRNPASVRLLPVTKTNPVEAAIWAYQSGMRSVAENRVQEAESKRPSAPAELRWELIGHLQSNKAKQALQVFDVMQTVDSAELVVRLGRLAAELGLVREIMLQVNAGDDPAKFGCDLTEAPRLLEAAMAQSALRVTGLMAVAPLSDDPAVAERTFTNLRRCRDTLAASFGVALPELSMGMSGDLESAVAAGSTCLRIGSALYGSRSSA